MRRLAAVALGAACTLLLAASPALAEPQVDGEFSVSGLGTYNQITTGPDGNLWVTLDGGTNDVARITPAGDVQEFNPTDLASPVGITSLGNNLWVTQSGSVAKFSPDDPSAAEKFDIATLGDPQAITVGPDGNLWTASGTRVFKISPSSPASPDIFAEVTGARGIAAGGDGNIWVADAVGPSIVSLTTAGDQAAGSPYSVAGGGPQGIAAGPGVQMAFTDPLSDPHRLGRITPGGTPLFTPIGTCDPFGITFFAADGAYWVGRFSTNDIGRLTPDGQFTTLGGFSANAGPRQLTTGPGNTLWVTLQTADKVARVTGFDSQPPPSGVPETPAENDFEFGKVKKNKKKGTATLTVIVPGPGDLELAATKKVKGAEKSAEAAGEVKLEVKPKGKAKQKLNQEGKAKVEVAVTYTPTGGAPNTEDKKLKLVKSR